MLRKKIIPVFLVFSFLILVVLPTAVAAQTASQPLIQSSNYCLSCHSEGDTRLEDPTSWVGGIDHSQISPCPSMVQVQEELYYTGRLMLAIERARSEVPTGLDLGKNESRLEAAAQNYSRLLDTPVNSLDAFSAEASMVRYNLGKVYTAVNQAIESTKRARVTWAAVAVSVVTVSSLIWGWVNTQKAMSLSQRSSKRSLRFYLVRAVLLLLIFTFFALPIFRIPSQAVTMPTTEEQEQQAVFDETGRTAQTADRELIRAWILAQIGAEWKGSDPDQSNRVLEGALVAARQAMYNTAPLWGETQAAWEAGGAELNTKAEAALVAADLDAARGRAWGLRRIAEIWMEIDLDRTQAILEEALALTDEAVYPYQQLDMRALAVTWAKFDLQKGLALSRRISDPAMRSWALREIAVISGDLTYLDQAAQTARLVQDPVQRARALREVGMISSESILFEEAVQSLQEVDGSALAFALADLAAASGKVALVAQIPSAYPSAQALAYYQLDEYENAWDAAAQIADPFERARAQAAIASAWENTEAAKQITIPLLRDRALRDISLRTGNFTLVEEIQDSYYQVQVLTVAGHYDQAWQAAADLHDGLPLVDLGSAWAANDLQSATQVLNELNREVDKAVVWREIAAVSGHPDDFESALGMALAARVRGDVLSPVRASLELADAFAMDPVKFEAAMLQAYQAALKINIDY